MLLVISVCPLVVDHIYWERKIHSIRIFFQMTNGESWTAKTISHVSISQWNWKFAGIRQFELRAVVVVKRHAKFVKNETFCDLAIAYRPEYLQHWNLNYFWHFWNFGIFWISDNCNRNPLLWMAKLSNTVSKKSRAKLYTGSVRTCQCWSCGISTM